MSVRAPVGELNIADRDFGIGRGLCAIAGTKADTSFLWHALHRSVESLAQRAQGSTFSAVNKDVLCTLPLPLPPLPEQRRIASILDSVDRTIEQTKAVIEQTKVVKKGLTQQLLTRGLPGRHKRFKKTPIGMIPEGWEVSELGAHEDLITSGSRGWAKHVSQDGALFFGITQLSREGVFPLMEGIRRVDPPLDAEGKRTQVRPGDILISITADLGITAVVPDEIGEGYVSQHVALARLLPAAIRPEFVARFLASPRGQLQFRTLGDSGAKAGLNLASIRRLVFPLPCLQEQDEILESHQAVESALRIAEQHQMCLELLKQGLMRALLMGKVRVVVDTAFGVQASAGRTA